MTTSAWLLQFQGSLNRWAKELLTFRSANADYATAVAVNEWQRHFTAATRETCPSSHAAKQTGINHIVCKMCKILPGILSKQHLQTESCTLPK